MKTDIIKLDDGEYTISEFTVGDFIEIEKKFGNLTLEQDKLEPIMYWLWLAIKRNHKDMILEKLYELVPASFISSGGLANIFDKLSELNDWKTPSKKVVSPPNE